MVTLNSDWTTQPKVRHLGSILRQLEPGLEIGQTTWYDAQWREVKDKLNSANLCRND